MLTTPDYSHFSQADYDIIYEPSEDTFLFLDALESDIHSLNDHVRPEVIVEIGSGSGLVINFLAMHLNNSNEKLFIATDINQNACRATQRTSEKNSPGRVIQVINCDLVTPLRDRLRKKIDVLLFNPPYVVTEGDELGSRSLQAAWAGGERGRQVMDRLFPLLDELLSQRGVLYLVCIRQNDLDDIERVMSEYGFSMRCVLSRKAGIEHLFVLRFDRK